MEDDWRLKEGSILVGRFAIGGRQEAALIVRVRASSDTR
jgi:hypothetical protein